MKHIDKTSPVYSTQFNAISDRLISSGIIRYNEVSDSDRSSMKQILHTEQSGLCAYCMQEIPVGTNDHVIPRSIEQRRFNGLHRKSHLRSDIVHTRSWSVSVHISNNQVEFYPHDIAYGNIVLACNTCNSKKDNLEINPIFFQNPTGVSYSSAGKMEMPPTAFCNELRAYLNEKANCGWRNLWYKIKKSGVTDSQILNAHSHIERMKLMCQVFGVPHLPPTQIVLLNDTNWKILISFRWFYNYY